MWPVIGGLISGLGSLFGASQTNQQSAANVAAQNAANAQQQAQAEAFNANQAQISQNFAQSSQLQAEDFNAGQVAQQEAFQKQSIADQENFQANQAAVQRNYETNMSNTAYQRASADMKAAGLNPMMMFGGGGAASTPSVVAPMGASSSGAAASVGSPTGSSASISPVRMERASYQSPLSSVGQVIGQTISNAVQLKTMDKMADEMANLEVQNNKLKQETLTEGQRTLLTADQASKTAAEAAAVRMSYPVLLNAAKTAQNELDINPSVRSAADAGARLGGSAAKVVSPITGLISSARGVQGLFQDRWGP